MLMELFQQLKERFLKICQCKKMVLIHLQVALKSMSESCRTFDFRSNLLNLGACREVKEIQIICGEYLKHFPDFLKCLLAKKLESETTRIFESMKEKLKTFKKVSLYMIEAQSHIGIF